jgi:hypothetical protein
MFYEEKKIELDKLIADGNKTILLTPKTNLLDEVVIGSSSSKYVVLTAYYRVYNFTNKTVSSFIDAEVKFIIKNNSIQKKIINHRIFDTTPKEEYYISSKNPFYINDLDGKSLLEILNSKFYLIKGNDSGAVNIIGRKDKKLYGIISKTYNPITDSNIRIDVSKRSKYFDGIQVEEYNNQNLSNVTIKDLKYRCSEFSHTSVDGKKTDYVNKREIFIENVEYLSKAELKKINKLKKNDISVSRYSKEFWKNLDNFIPLNSVVESDIKKFLIERK